LSGGGGLTPQQSPTYILAGTQTNRHTAGGPSAYLQYVRHITSQAQAAGSGAGISGQQQDPAYASGYADFLQAPLQPLFDDLGSATYDVFERDPVKYRQYEEATYLALQDLPEGQR
jgi:protein arginine N-methyltransferase 5